jgi:hypothetical protein
MPTKYSVPASKVSQSRTGTPDRHPITYSMRIHIKSPTASNQPLSRWSPRPTKPTLRRDHRCTVATPVRSRAYIRPRAIRKLRRRRCGTIKRCSAPTPPTGVHTRPSFIYRRFGLRFDLGHILAAAQSEGRGDGVTGAQVLRHAEAAIAEDRPQFGMDLQEEVPVGAVGVRGVVDDFHD